MLTDTAFLRYHRSAWIHSSQYTELNCEIVIYYTHHTLTNVGILYFESNHFI